MEIPSFTRGKPLYSSEFLHHAFDYIPLAPRQEIYKTFYIGFYNFFKAVSNVLDTTCGVPTPQAVMAATWELNVSAVQFYLRKGGRVENVLDAVVGRAREQSNLGDGTFEETFDCDEGDFREEREGRLAYRDLGACRNDLEFGVVRRKVGVGGSWGPYL